MVRSPNRLLTTLIQADCEPIRPHLRDFELLRNRVLVSAGDEMKSAYFPQSGIIALVVGVQRNAVSFVASTLRDKGLIRFSRALIRILDVAGLKAIACECYENVRNELEQLEGGTVH